MSKIHQISHDNAFIRGKVNFFADYFDYAAENCGRLETIDIENELALIEKILFQIDTNPKNNSQYIEAYLTHHMMKKLFSESKDKRLKKLSELATEFLSKKPGERKEWIYSNGQFRLLLLTIKRSLQRKSFKESLKNIVSYLLCVHPIEKHKNDLIAQTNSIVSEFILNDRSKADLDNVFQKILSRKIDEFPFPKSLIDKGADEKEAYIKNRTFTQQFDGIYNQLKAPLDKTFLLFRVYGLKAPDTFFFKYDNVELYSPSHKKLDAIFKQVKATLPLSDYLTKDSPVVAVVKAESHSIDISVNKAHESMRRAILFVNNALNANCRIERFVYLYTADFKDFGWSLNAKAHPYKINESSPELLKDNPYQTLRKSSRERKVFILRYEHLFIEASTTQNISTYWHYIETIIPGSKKIETAADIIILDSEKRRKRTELNQILNTIIQGTPDHLGLDSEYHRSLFAGVIERGIKKNELKTLRKRSSHQFLNHLLDQYFKPFDRRDLLEARAFCVRILKEAYAQRNSMLHSGVVHDKSIIQITGSLPRLVQRLRVRIITGIRKKVADSHSGIVEALSQQGRNLYA